MSYYYHSITGHSVQPENVILDEALCFESKYKLRAGDYVHLTGELQIADSISVNAISGIVVDLENSPKDAANKIEALCESFGVAIPVTILDFKERGSVYEKKSPLK